MAEVRGLYIWVVIPENKPYQSRCGVFVIRIQGHDVVKSPRPKLSRRGAFMPFWSNVNRDLEPRTGSDGLRNKGVPAKTVQTGTVVM